MTVKEILEPVIIQEFQRYERNGCKVKLKSAGPRKVKYSLICGAIALFGLAMGPGAVVVWLITVPVYISLMKKTKPVELILALAEKNPDTPIDRIIAMEMMQ